MRAIETPSPMEVYWNIFSIFQEYKVRLLLRCTNNIKTDLFDNMDHMRISGTELSSVILIQTK